MNKAIDYFNSMEHINPKCPNCGSKIVYGVTTEFNDEAGTHVCLSCKSPL